MLVENVLISTLFYVLLARSRWSIDSGSEMLVRYGVVGKKIGQGSQESNRWEKGREARSEVGQTTLDKGEEKNTHDSRSLLTPRNESPCKKK